MQNVIEVENIGKQYRLGLVGATTISDDLKRTMARVMGKEDPFHKLGQLNDRSVKSSGNYVWALKDVSFELKQGEVLGIVGKNGAGKSTLLKLLSRITTPSTGSIRMKGRAGSLLEVGTGFHPELTGKENIFLNGAILGMTKTEIRRKLDEIVHFSGIEKYIDTPVKRYSSGMMVRLGFAVAAHLEPEILIIDEVLAVGDVEFQKRCIGKMKEVSSYGRTILFVSHNMGAVRSLCTRGILLENGLCTYEGTADEVVDKYLVSASSDSQTMLTWEGDKRPGNEYAKIEQLSINSGKENTVGIFEDMQIRVVFELLEHCKGRLDVGIEIQNDKGDIVCSIGTGQKESQIDTVDPGKFEFTFDMVNRLNEGLYHITLRINENRRSRAKTKIENILSFEIVASTDAEYRRFPGIVRPEFKYRATQSI